MQKNNQKPSEKWYIKLINALKNIFICGLIVLLLVVVFFLTLEKVNVWPFAIFSIFIICLFNIKTFVQNFEIFKIGKDGVELKRITQDAQNATEELKKIASLFSKNMAMTMTRLGRWDSFFTAKELYENRIEMEKLLSSVNIHKNEIRENLQIIDNFILFEIILTISERYNQLEKVKICKELNHFIAGPQKGLYNPDITKIQQYLSEKNLLDDKNSRILSEAKYFQKNKSFKTDDFLSFIEDTRNDKE